MHAFRQDLVYALRVLGKDRAYSAAVILTLAVCLGANTAIFTVVRSVLLRPLPYPDSHRVVSLYDGFPGAGVERAGTSVPNYADRRAMTDVFSSAALFQPWGYKVGQGTRAESVPGDECDAVVLRGARNNRGSRPPVRGGRRHARQEQGRAPQPHLCGAAARGHRCGRRTPTADGRRGLRRRRCAAGNILLPESGDPGLRAPGVRARGPPRGPPLEPEPRAAGAAGPWSHARTGPGQDGRAQRRRDRACRAAQRHHYSRRLHDQGSASRRRPGPQRPRSPADALGWRLVRGPDCRRQHRQSRARAHERAHQGAGHAHRHRGAEFADRAAADHRSDGADDRRCGARPSPRLRSASTPWSGSALPICRGLTRSGSTRWCWR